MIKSYNGFVNELFISDLPGTTFKNFSTMFSHLKYEYGVDDKGLSEHINEYISGYYISFVENIYWDTAQFPDRSHDLLCRYKHVAMPIIKVIYENDIKKLIFYDNKNKEHIVSRTDLITFHEKYKNTKRIYSPEDPYGEEDWEVNEEFDLFGKKKKDDVVRLYKDIVLKGIDVLKRTFFYADDLELIIPVKKFLADHGFRIDPHNMKKYLFSKDQCFGITNKPWERDGEEFTRWCDFNLIGNYTHNFDYLVSLTDFVKMINILHDKGCLYIKHKIAPEEKKENIHKNVDPYGEEDWEDYENNYDY